MTNNALNISIPIKFEIKTPPRGMTDYDPKALSADQQKELNTYKLTIRKENILYLREHPEVRALVTMICREIQIQKPRNVVEYVAKIFSRPENRIRDDVISILNEKHYEYEPIPYSEFEGWDY